MKRKDIERAKEIEQQLNVMEARKETLKEIPDEMMKASLYDKRQANTPNRVVPIKQDFMDIRFLRDMAIRECEKEINRLEKELEGL